MLFVFLATLSLNTTDSVAQTLPNYSGLHFTPEELTIWRQRAKNGPYKSKGDVSTNSPGDWDRIVSKANVFRSNPSAEVWSGQPGGSCWSSNSGGTPALPGRDRGEKLLDAAFYYLITGDTQYRDAVRSKLLAQAVTPGTDFSDTSRWRISKDCTWGSGHSHEITTWLTRLTYAYDYIRPTLPSADKNTLDTWFLNAGHFWEDVVDRTLQDQRYPNRNSDDYVTFAPGWNLENPSCISHNACITHYNGWTVNGWSGTWNNRNANQIRAAGLIGILLNDAHLKNQAKRFVKEWFKNAVYPDNTNADFHRWKDNAPGLGWHYTGQLIGTVAALADSFARIGDTELYDFSTSEGVPKSGATVPNGGSKSIKGVIELFMRLTDHTIRYFGTDRASRATNPDYLIDSIDDVAGRNRNHDTIMAQANVYFQDEYVKSVYTRTSAGAPPYPANPSGFGSDVWGGEWGTLPGVLFMFGQMEGKVWPYSDSSPQPSPDQPSTGGISVGSTYTGYSTAPIDDDIIDADGGTATTWASADSSTNPHWIEITFAEAKTINTATLHWAFNNSRQKYMTSQQVDVQYWNDSSYQTAATMTYPGIDTDKSTVTFTPVTTTKLRFYQPANQGNPTYAGVLWITEADYNYVGAPQPPGNFRLTSE